MRHLLGIEQMTGPEMEEIFRIAGELKSRRSAGRQGQAEANPANPGPLQGEVWALLFAKSSTRTRVSFEVGVRQLGGQAIFLNAADIQLGRGEPIKDTARVLGRMVQGAIIRTYAQADVEEFAHYGKIPTINALTDQEHPCQILADIFTYQEKRGPIAGKTVAFFGDADCNVARSWIFAAPRLGFELRLAAPPAYQPGQEYLRRAGGKVVCLEDAALAAKGADLLYTDVWVSMGKEAETAKRLAALSAYQLNGTMTSLANPDPLVMHCLPAYRGKEIDERTFEAHAGTIFDQAENRLHVQKAILLWLIAGRPK